MPSYAPDLPPSSNLLSSPDLPPSSDLHSSPFFNAISGVKKLTHFTLHAISVMTAQLQQIRAQLCSWCGRHFSVPYMSTKLIEKFVIHAVFLILKMNKLKQKLYQNVRIFIRKKLSISRTRSVNK